jgi:protein-disulfide isomerase
MTVRTIVMAAALSLAASPAFAQVDLQTIEQQNRQILDELKAIRQVLERLIVVPQPAAARPAAPQPPVTFATIPTDRVLGSPSAPITMVEFTDLQCPFCRQFQTTVFDALKRDYIDTGKVRFISRDLPLEAIHPMAVGAARMTRCALEQNRFWEMRHALLVNNARLSLDLFDTLATQVGLDDDKLDACLANTARLDAMIKADIAAAMSADLQATPAFVIGRTQAAGLVGERFMGAQPYAAFDAKLKQLLADIK